MENNNLDWMAVQTQVGDASFADIYNLGVDPSSVTLDTKTVYKGKKKIKENPAFQTNGKFDDQKFDQFYDMSVKTLNAYKSSDYSIGSGNIPEMNLWEDTGLARSLGQKTFKDPISVSINKDPQTNLKLAQKSNLGFIDINQWSDPQKTIAEVAQSQKVIDGLTGKELSYSPEDSGFSNAFGFFNEPLVLSAYDEDVKDASGNIIHKRGETKFDEKGLPRYETLAGRSASGKQLLSRMDTLTKEDSYINKFDFMDSDGFNKSLTGSIMKTAVNLIPLTVGGPVATAAKAYFIADGLIQAGTEIGKALTGIIGGPGADKNAFYKSLNEIQTFTKQWKSGTSENAKNNFFAMENVLNLASDSVYQLMGQQALSLWPQRVRQYQMAKELNLNPNILQSLSKGGDEALTGVFQFEKYLERYGDDAAKAAIALSRNVDALKNTGRYASYGARAFMAATSAVGISDVADEAGLDARDKGLLYLGYTAGLVPLFGANIGKWVEGGHEVDELAKGMNNALKKYASQYISPIAKTAQQEAIEAAELAAGNLAKESLSGLAKLKGNSLNILKAGRDLGARVAKRFDNINNPTMAGLAEGVEEVTEEVLQDAVKGIYNGLSSLGFTSTKNKQIDFDIEDTMTRYGQAFVGGAIGGMIFKFADPNVKIKPFISDEMKEYVANGYGEEVIASIRTMADAGQLGSKQLSINKQMNAEGILESDVWAPVNSDNPVSQNDFIADRMIKEVRANMKHLDVFGLTNQDVIVEGKNKFYDTIVDTRTDTDLRDRVRGASDNLIRLNTELSEIEETDINAEAIKKKKEEIKLAKEEFDYLMSDESVDEYFRQGLFNINTEINSKFGVKTRQTFTDELIGSNYKYNTLNETDKLKVDEAFDGYRMSTNDTYGIKVDLRNARLQMEGFHIDMEKHGGYEAIENYNESLKTINEAFDLITNAEENTTYVKPVDAVIDNKPSGNILITLNEEFYDKLNQVQYVPDFLHDEINKRLEELKTSGLNNSIIEVAVNNKLEINPDDIRTSLLSNNITNLNSSLPIQSLFRTYLSKFKPVTVFDSPVYTALKAEGNQTSLSRMIKVLGEVDNIEDNSIEKNIYEIRKEAIDQLTPEQAVELLAKAPIEMQYSQDVQDIFLYDFNEIIEGADTVDNAIKTEVYNLLNDIDYESMLEDVDPDDLQILNSDVAALRLLHNINKQNFLSAATGQSEIYDFNSLVNHNNILLDHAIDGSLNDPDKGLSVDNYVQIDSQIDEFITKTENAVKTKASSPLATFLADTYRFKANEFETVIKGGASNYVNNSLEFTKTLDDHIAKTEKVDAFMKMLYFVNPIINQWRVDNKDIVPKELQDEVLTTIDDKGYGTIYQASVILLNELKYLRDLNDFNKNNTLAKLLKEDGRLLASSFHTLTKIESIPEIAENLPSVSAALQDVTIKEYVDDIDNATDESKIIALGAMAKYEDLIYKEFQTLNSAAKQQLIDLTFKPINSTSYTFRTSSSPDAPLNDMHQTLYLAKIFGSSSVTYTEAIAGEEIPEGYSKIADAVMDPFPNQEAAIRIAYLNRFGDPLVYESLITAYAYKNQKDGPVTFKRGQNTGIDLKSVMTVVGDPGVGKTKAIIAGILSFDNDKENDTVLLGSVKEHVENLTLGVVDAGYENRINAGMSKSIHDFIKDLNLTDRDNRLVNIETNSDEVLNKLFNVDSNYKPAYTDDLKVQTLLSNTTNFVLGQVKLTEANGDFNEVLTKKLKGIRNIIIDEYTHANPVDVAILINIVNAYNRSLNNNADNKITVVLAGDNNQLGFSIKEVSRTFGDFMPTVTSVPLTTSLRSGWDLVNNVLTEIKDRTSQLNDMSNAQVIDPVTASRLKQVTINLNHTIANGNPIGIYREVTSGETTTDNLRFFRDHLDAIKSSPNSLVYVAQSQDAIPAAEALLRNLLGVDWKTYASVLTATTTQGREYKYAIVDASPDTSEKDPYKVKKGYKFLNTMLSRATEATLLIDKGAYDEFVSWSQVEVPKAIDQKKLTSEMIVKIKENRQNIAKSILNSTVGVSDVKPTEDKVEDSAITPELERDVEDTIKSDGDGVQTENDSKSKSQSEILEDQSVEPIEEVKASAEILPILNVIDEIALFSEEPVTLTEASDDFARTSPYMVNAYTSFTFKRDVDSIKALMGNNLNDRDAEALLRPLKEWTSYKDFSNNYYSNSPLMNKLRYEGYSSGRTVVRVRALKRDVNFMTVGRSRWKNNYVESEGQDLLIIEAIIPNNKGREPFIFTMGTFNSLDNIQKFGGDTQGVKNFLNLVRQELAANKEWTSPEFSLKEWKALSETKEFAVDFRKVVNGFDELRKNYNTNIRITDPMVVIAKGNVDTMSKWKQLTGSSIALITEHEALQSMNESQLYDIYSKQLEYYNNDEFKNKTYAEKVEFINSRPKIEGTNITPRPKLVQLIKLANPKYNFTQFVTNYAAFQIKLKTAKANGKTLKTQSEVREFEMSPYVADRLIKSMMVIHRMLTDENAEANKVWFNQNVLPNTKSNVLNDISAFMLATEAEAKANGDDFNFGSMTAADLVSSETDATAIRSAEDLVEQLDKFLYGNPNLVRGVYDTVSESPSSVKGIDLNPNVDLRKILPDTLSNDKFKDFSSGGVLNVKNLAIYSSLQPSFLKMISETFKSLGSIPSNGPMGKYSLQNVFRDGLIENIIVAGVGSNGRNINNVLAPVLKTSLSNGFKTNVASLQTASFYVNFDGMMDKINVLTNSDSQSANERIEKEETERRDANKWFVDALGRMGVNANYEGYEELVAMSFPTVEAATEYLQGTVELTLRNDVIPVDPYMKYKITTVGTGTSFMDHAVSGSDPTPINMMDNGNLITLTVDYTDKIETITFDKKNNYNVVITQLFKESETFNATDEAKRFIDANNLTKESVIEMASTPLPDTQLAYDLSPMRGQNVTLNTLNGPKLFKIVSSSIGIDGSDYNSFVTVENEEGRQNIRMSELPMELTSKLNVHSRALQKQTEFYNNPENHEYGGEIYELLEAANPNLDVLTLTSITDRVLEQLELSNNVLEINDRSNYNTMMDLINRPKTLIVSPWGPNIPVEYQPLLEAYTKLAEALYADNLHNTNGFINNFSIFANGEWKQYQTTIDNTVVMTDPELSKQIIKLEEQLNKLTHDC